MLVLLCADKNKDQVNSYHVVLSVMLLTRTGLQSVRATKVLNRSFSCSAVAMRDITKEIEAQIRSKKCVVYMRGDTALPQCKFSKAVVDALRSVGVLVKRLSC